jgi:hypothetical protein
MDISRDDRALLAEIGFMGSITNRTADARLVLGALPAAGREATIGLALADMTDGRPEEAATRLAALADDTDALALRILALRLAGRGSEAERLAGAVPAGDEPAQRLARALAG